MERVVILLGFGRCNRRRAGNRGWLVHTLPEGVLGLFRRTLDGGRACRCFRHWRDHHACRGCALVRSDAFRTFVIIAAVVVADRLKLSSQLALSLFGSLDLSTLGGKSSLLLRRVLLCGCTALLLFCPLQLASLDFLFKRTQRSLLLFALLLQFTLLSSFLVPSNRQ
jgi:hypothetical protein